MPATISLINIIIDTPTTINIDAGQSVLTAGHHIFTNNTPDTVIIDLPTGSDLLGALVNTPSLDHTFDSISD